VIRVRHERDVPGREEQRVRRARERVERVRRGQPACAVPEQQRRGHEEQQVMVFVTECVATPGRGAARAAGELGGDHPAVPQKRVTTARAQV